MWWSTATLLLLVLGSMLLMAWHLIQDATVDLIVEMPKDRDTCERWIDSLREAGLSVRVLADPDPVATFREHHVPHALEADHTAILVNGRHYLIVGHVPADAIVQLRDHTLPIHGLAVPGTPAGAPGFSGTGAYEIWAFTLDGHTYLFEKRSVVRRIAQQGDAARPVSPSTNTYS